MGSLEKIFTFLILADAINLFAETPEVGGARGADYARHITSAPHLFGRCGVSEIPIDIYMWGVDYAHQIVLSPFDSKMFRQAWIKVRNSPASPAGTIA